MRLDPNITLRRRVPADNPEAGVACVGCSCATDRNTFLELARSYRDPMLSRNAAFFDAISRSPGECVQILRRVKNMQVAVIGCGGLGNAVAYMLASLGICRLILIDGDRVERSNLNRQFLFTRASVGKKKALELARALRARFSQTTLVVIPFPYPSARGRIALHTANQIVCVADDPPDLFLTLRSDSRVGQKLWSAGYVMGVSVTGGAPVAASAAESWRTHRGYFAPSVSFQNMEIASTLVRRMVLDENNQRTRVYDYRAAKS